MHFDTSTNAHGMKHDPIKALVAPRPIGWVSSVGRDGSRNLAPYSFFNMVSDRPPMVMFSSSGRKDTLRNIEETGEFTCSLATWDLRDAMNLSSATVPYPVDEFELAGLEAAPSMRVRPPRVALSPAALECTLWKTLAMPVDPARPEHVSTVVFGTVVAVYIDEAVIRDGRVDTAAIRPLARLGYMDYATVTAESMFTLNRPRVDADGRATVVPGEWDGVYR